MIELAAVEGNDFGIPVPPCLVQRDHIARRCGGVLRLDILRQVVHLELVPSALIQKDNHHAVVICLWQDRRDRKQFLEIVIIQTFDRPVWGSP
jgi:hypothetical protein